MSSTDNLHSEIISVPIEDEVKRSYLDYAMSVIVSRALPDIRDGLKPVHRRILYAMNELGCFYQKPHKKSARIVGDVMGKYHPHGDAAIYDALVRMAQDFSMRLPLIDGQGNFGSIDRDSAAAMRYTESRLALSAQELLEDIDKETVDFRPNYDGSEHEPAVLPASYPNLLVNGSEGIAVGMATNIPPHNLGEVIEATCALINNPDLTDVDLGQFIKGPDFPTAGLIVGTTGIKSAIATGRGSVLMRGKVDIEDMKNGKTAIIISEIPYQVNKAKMVERIAELVQEKKIEGISDLRDESDRNGIRVVIELKKDVVADVIINQLYSYTPLQTSFGVNLLALYKNKPELLSYKQVLQAFIEFREEIVTRRTIFLLRKLREKGHILIGLSVAVANIDEVIVLIKAAKDSSEAKEALMKRKWPAAHIKDLLKIIASTQTLDENDLFTLSEDQAKAILDMRLHRLTGLEHQKINDELTEISKEIQKLLEIINSREILLNLIKTELQEVSKKFATPRITQIIENEIERDIEDLIQREDMVMTITMGGYIKRVPLDSYRAQRRGGKGRSGVNLHEEDATTDVIVTNTHAAVLFFSNFGIVYRLKVYKLPLGTPQSKGRAMVNIFPLDKEEHITTVLPLPEDTDSWSSLNIVFVTKNGNIRRNSLEDFRIIQSNGKLAIKLEDNDSLVGVVLCKPQDNIMLATREGKAIRFSADAVRLFKGRASVGVRGIRLMKGDSVISMSVLRSVSFTSEDKEQYLKIPLEEREKLAQQALNTSSPMLFEDKMLSLAANEEFILTITTNGYGKRTSAYEYRITNRGGQGIANISTSQRNGQVVASFPVKEEDHIMLITDKGKLIRIHVHDIRIIGRNTQGVSLFHTNEGEEVRSAARIVESDTLEDESSVEQSV